MLAHVRRKTFIFGNHVKPKLIVSNYSKVLSNACLFKLNSQHSTEKFGWIYKNLAENKTCRYKTVIHIRAAHLLRKNKLHLQKH